MEVDLRGLVDGLTISCTEFLGFVGSAILGEDRA
jgi:hypothetical protein